MTRGKGGKLIQVYVPPPPECLNDPLFEGFYRVPVDIAVRGTDFVPVRVHARGSRECIEAAKEHALRAFFAGAADYVVVGAG